MTKSSKFSTPSPTNYGTHFNHLFLFLALGSLSSIGTLPIKFCVCPSQFLIRVCCGAMVIESFDTWIKYSNYHSFSAQRSSAEQYCNRIIIVTLLRYRKTRVSRARKTPTHPTHGSLSSIGTLPIKFCVCPSQFLIRVCCGVMVISSSCDLLLERDCAVNFSIHWQAAIVHRRVQLRFHRHRLTVVFFSS